jgi:hypothetical protein
MSVEELRAMEDELWDDLREANEELLAARAYAVEGEDDEEANLITTSIVTKESRDKDDILPNEGNSEALKIPESTLQAFSNEQGLRNRYAGTSLKSQWGKLRMGIFLFLSLTMFLNRPLTLRLNFFLLELAQETAAAMRLIPESEIVKSSIAWWRRHLPCCGEKLKAIPKYYGYMQQTEMAKAFVTALDHPTYAVVTFSSRQAAIAARQCLADGGVRNTWKQVDDIPIPPLADAPPRNICFFRGCWYVPSMINCEGLTVVLFLTFLFFCFRWHSRPVTLTINYKEKKLRRWSYVFGTARQCYHLLSKDI